jgi:antirestriction protein ArdC
MNPKVKLAIESLDQKIESLANSIGEIQASEEMKRYLDFMAAFHNYSWHNCILIASQFPEATRVAGFKKWQSLGRNVKKGGKGIMILCPRFKKIETQKTVNEEKVTETGDILYFVPGYVFDVSQTDGESLPELCQWLTGDDHKQFYAALWTLAQSWDIIVTETAMIDAQSGASKVNSPEIALNNRHEINQRVFTLAHEIAHQILHRDEKRPDSVRIRETEAESVAYIVCSHFGFDVEYHAAAYLAMYRADADGLKKSIARIREASRRIISGLYGDSEKAELKAA